MKVREQPERDRDGERNSYRNSWGGGGGGGGGDGMQEGDIKLILNLVNALFCSRDLHVFLVLSSCCTSLWLSH